MLTISAGHYGRGTGASGLIDEGSEVIEIVSALQTHFQASTIGSQFIIDRYSKNQAQNLRYLMAAHNKTNRVLDVSIHFNAISGIREAGIGTEVLYVNPKLKDFAASMSAAIANAGGFKDRGAKHHTNLAWLNGTAKPAIILEVCFVNSKADVHCYQKNKAQIIEAIFKELINYCDILKKI